MPWTTDELLADMKRQANLPAGANAKFNDAALLRMAYEVLIKQVDPILLTLQEEYDVVREDFAITANDATYRLPERCVSGTIMQALILDKSGTPSQLERIAPSEAWAYEGPGARASIPGMFTLEGSLVRLLPMPTSTGLTLRLRYRRRPSSFVLTSACGVVSSVGATTLAAPGGSFSSPSVVDVVRARPPVGVIVQQQSATYAGNVFTFAAGVLDDADVQVGDYVCVADRTCVVQVPERFHMLFTDLATAQLLQEWGVPQSAADWRAAVDAYLPTLKTAQSNRVAAQPTLAIARGGALRGAFGRGWGRR